MTVRRSPGAPIRPEDELLDRLGLDGRASIEDVARRHDELVTFLATAPRSLWPWARAQAAAVDDLFAALSDPSAPRQPEALSDLSPRTDPQPGGPATPPARQAAPSTPIAGEADPDEGEDFAAMLAAVTPSTHRDSVRTAPAHAAPAPRVASKTRSRLIASTAIVEDSRGGTLRKAAIAAVAVVAIGAAGFGVWKFGLPAAASTAVASPTPAPTASLDAAKVAALMAKYQADPKDTQTLMDLGNEFYRAEDFATAADWIEKVVTLEPSNVTARLALGAARFNLGDEAAAKAQWTEVLKLDANNVEAHYDLGYLYFYAEPQDIPGVQREWGEVVRLAPDSDAGKFVKAHLDALTAQASGAPSAAPSAATSPAPSAAASPAPSAAPSGSGQP